MKSRMIAGYMLQTEGLVGPGLPIKASCSIPVDSTPIDLQIDPNGNFVLFVEVKSHPPGDPPDFFKYEVVVSHPNVPIDDPDLVYRWTAMRGPTIFFAFVKTDKTFLM